MWTYNEDVIPWKNWPFQTPAYVPNSQVLLFPKRSNKWGCQVSFRFPIVKILDYQEREAELEQSANPFAAVILAQLKVLETRASPQTRWQWKLRLVKGLYERGLSRNRFASSSGYWTGCWRCRGN